MRWLRIGFAILASMVGITAALQISFGESVSEADQVAQAVAVGTTSATGDTEVRTVKVRRTWTRDSVLACLYNTAIPGAAIGLINGE